MPTSTNVTNLKINELTEAQYDAAVQGGVIGENELSVITDMDIDAIQVSTMPTAAAGELGNIYQFVGTTDANYTHGYFYECVSDGATPPVYSWSQVNVQPGGGSSLPSQTGNSGKFLTTDGTDASWSDTPLVNSKLNTAQNAVGILGYAGANTSIAIGYTALTTGAASVAVGESTQTSGAYSTAVGYNARTSKMYAIQLGYGTNDEQNTFRVGLAGSAQYNYKMLDSDGTIPEARLADTTNATTGDVLQLDSNGNAVWAAGGGGGGLPSQTGNSGKFLTTDGTNASWGEALKRVGSQSKDLGIFANAVTGSINPTGTAIGIGAESESYGGSSVAVGYQAVAGTSFNNTYSCVALGPRCKATGSRGIAIGYNAQATAACAMQIGPGTNSTANTCQLGYYNGSSFTTYQLLDFITGTIPAARHATLPAADGTYTLQLVITNGVPTLSWVAE